MKMSREIKFRAWDKKRKCYAKAIQTTNQGWKGYRDKTYITNGIMCFSKWVLSRFIIEQYTGLTDKNGKEIYEGDIVRARWYRAKSARFNVEGKVEFIDGWFHINDDPDCHDRFGVPIHNCYNLEVIGNVHEKLLGGEA